MSSAKTKARRCTVQALYQWQMAGQNLKIIERQFVDDGRLKNAQKSYFIDIFHGIPENLAKIDETFLIFVDRKIEEIDPVERAILRIGTYELMYKIDVPYRVVINEGVELAKLFGADGSHKYVNGVLDKVAQKQRKVEIEAKKVK
jgi:N utilization substance protein B